MKDEALDAWGRARKSLLAAEKDLEIDPDSTASRAYYAAFHAVTALFALQDQSFSKHAGMLAAVHRDLVHTGRWSEDLGAAYSWLMKLRVAGDYGGMREHVSDSDAEKAIEAAMRILDSVHQAHPDLFPFPAEKP